jgi:RNA-directed DNA polymerase
MTQTDYQIQINQLFQNIETKEQLLELLNLAQVALFGDECSPIKLGSLTYYANPTICKNRYISFVVKKKSGSDRQINAPVRGLKHILRCLNYALHCVHYPHQSATGFAPGKSIVDNAKKHIDSRHVYNIDLQDFFHSFDRNRVKMAFMYSPFNLGKQKEPIAFLLACLCTHSLQIDGEMKLVLPQGSPTSPTLTNILCKQLDNRLLGLAKRFGCKYSRYADDITFSANKNVFRDSVFLDELTRIVEVNQNLKINPSKTRLQSAGYKQEITGLIVNEKVNVKKRYIKSLRMWLHYWEKYGYAKTSLIFAENYKADKVNSKGSPSLYYVLKGKLEFLKMVKGADDATYLKLKDRFGQLTYLRLKNNTKPDLDKVVETLVNKGLSLGVEMYKNLYN